MKCTKHIRHEHYLQVDGKKVKMARIEMEWTITKLAVQSGVTRKTISEIEKGAKKRIRFSTIHQLAITLGKQVEQFCTHIGKR